MVIVVIENYVLAKKIAYDKVGEDSKFYPLFVLCIYGLLCKYQKYKKEVEEIILDTIILIDNKSVNKIMRDAGLNPDEYFGSELGDVCPDDYENSNFYRGISIPGDNYVTNGEEFVNEKSAPYIICSTLAANEAQLMLTLMHEAGHLIKGKINNTYTTQGDDYLGYVIRSGLSIYEFRYYPEDDTFLEENSYEIFDEVINCLQTTDAAMDVLAIDGIIPDKDIQVFLDTVDKNVLKEDLAYEACTGLLKQLWKNDTFKRIIEDNIVIGNINKIIEEFDSILGEDSFDNLDDLLMIIDRLDSENKNNCEEMKKIIKKVFTIIEEFNKRTTGLGKVK